MNFNLKHFIQCFVQSSKKNTERSKAVLFCGSFLSFVFHVCHAVSSVPCSLVVTCWEISDLLALLYVIFSCVLSLSHMVSWVGQVRYLIV